MNTPLFSNVWGPDYRPSDLEDATRCTFIRYELKNIIKEYQMGKEPSHEYFFSLLPDEEVVEFRLKYAKDLPSAEGEDFIPVGAAAFHVIDYEQVLPVAVTDRKGFLYYCRSADDHLHYVPYHQLFRTEADAEAKIRERNSRRDAAIEKYHLLDQSDDADRQQALEWLYFNQDPPEGLIERLL